MKLKKIAAVCVLCLCSAMVLSGCSFSEFFDKIMGNVSEPEADSSAGGTVQQEVDAKTVDSTLDAPEFVENLGGSSQFTVGSDLTLSVQATVSDGGTVTYQWYKNNVNSNGGGTAIEGAEKSSYTVDTSEAGTVYYYVVATNTQGDRIYKSTSSIQEVNIWPLGFWQQDDVGFRYLLEDGTYPTNLWIHIEGQTYRVDGEGHRAVGWYQEGDYMYYFNEAGELQRNTTTPDGHMVDDNGIMIS